MIEGVPEPKQEKVAKVRDEAVEEQLFGVPIEEASPLLELYTYFSSEEMSLISAKLNMEWNEFRGVENKSQFDELKPDIEALAQYQKDFDAYGKYITSAQVMELKANYTPKVKALSRKLQAL